MNQRYNQSYNSSNQGYQSQNANNNPNSYGQGNGGYYNTQGTSSNDRRCFKCGQPNHIAKLCLKQNF